MKETNCSEGHEWSCWFAQGPVDQCKCECCGEHHGIALEKNLKTYVDVVKFLKEGEPYSAESDKHLSDKLTEAENNKRKEMKKYEKEIDALS